MAGIAFTRDVEITTNKFGVLLEESSQEISKILSDLVLVADVKYAAMGEASADGLVNIKEVGNVVPGEGVLLERAVRVELVGSVLVE